MTRKKTSADSNAKASADQKVASAKTVGADLSASDIAQARADGALEAEKEAAKDSYRYATDGNLPGDPDDAPRTFPGHDDIMQYEPLLRLGLKANELPGGGPGYTNDVHPISELR
jgi:hypothetical protein